MHPVLTDCLPQEVSLRNRRERKIDDRVVLDTEAGGVIGRASQPSADLEHLATKLRGLVDRMNRPVAGDAARGLDAELAGKDVREFDAAADSVIYTLKQGARLEQLLGCAPAPGAEAVAERGGLLRIRHARSTQCHRELG